MNQLPVVSPEQIASSPMDDWVDEHADALYRFAKLSINDDHVIEDLLQETYLAAVRGRSSFRGESSVRTWLIAILRLKIIDHRRREKSRLRSSVTTTIDQFEATRTEALRQWATQADNTIESSEFWMVFERCLAKLPETIARAFLLREVDGLPAEQIVDLLAISRHNLATRIFRARASLRECLDKHWFSLGEASE